MKRKHWCILNVFILFLGSFIWYWRNGFYFDPENLAKDYLRAYGLNYTEAVMRFEHSDSIFFLFSNPERSRFTLQGVKKRNFNYVPYGVRRDEYNRDDPYYTLITFTIDDEEMIFIFIRNQEAISVVVIELSTEKTIIAHQWEEDIAVAIHQKEGPYLGQATSFRAYDEEGNLIDERNFPGYTGNE